MRRSELLNLVWDRVDERVGIVRLRPEDTKEDDSRVIPISPEFAAILSELRDEQRKVPNIAARVFTREGKPIKNIQTAFERARNTAAIPDVVIHDFRHTAITN